MVRRKDTFSAASDPLAFLEKLSPVERDRFWKESEQALREKRADEFYGALVSQAATKIRPAKAELTPEEEQRLTNKVFEQFELRGRVKRLEKQLATKQHRRMESRSAIPSLKELRSVKSISKGEAADYLRRGTRTITNYIKAGKLTPTHLKRVATDDKFVQMLRKVHGNGILP